MSSRWPGISEPEQTIESMHNTILELKQLVEILTQQSGDRLNHAVTFKDLVDRQLISAQQLEINDNLILSGFSRKGTWTPGMTFGGSSSGVTYGSRGGQYVRFGSLVFADFFIVLTSNGSGTGDALVTGLPYRCGGQSGYGAIKLYSNFSGAVGAPFLEPQASTTTAKVKDFAATASITLQHTNVTDTANLYGSIIYITADT